MKSLSYGLLLLALANGSIAIAVENTDVPSTTPENEAMCTPGDSDNADTAAYTPASPPPPYAAKLRAEADAVLKGPDFHQMKSGTVPVPRPWLETLLKREKKKEEQPAARPNFSGIAQIMKIVVILVLVLLLGWLLWRGYQWLTPQLSNTQQPRRRGLAREAESLPLQDNTLLPDSVSASAARAWQAGQATEALSLLYRGAVASLASRYELSLPNGATEGDYQRLLRRSGRRELASGFNTISQAWMAQAYASRQPEDFSLLLQTYRQHFEAAGGAS